jgi:hypothetical protein
MPDFDGRYTLTLDNVNHIQNLDWIQCSSTPTPTPVYSVYTRVNSGCIIKRIEDKILFPLGGKKKVNAPINYVHLSQTQVN